MNLKQIIREEVRRQLKEFQGEEVLFSINDPKVDDFLQQRFSNYVDYANHKGDDVYVLPIQHYNRFIDQVDSLGYDTDSIQIIREGIKRQLKEMSNGIKDYSNSKNKILVGTKSNLLNDMKKRYDFEIDGDETYFFDKGFHFATLYQAGRFYELLHDGTLDDKGYRHQLKESSQWAIGKSVQYKNLKTAKSKIAKIVKKLGNGKWELDGGHIAYEKDPEFKLMNEAYGSDFSGSGLVVIGRTYTDDNRLQKFIDDKKYYGGIWNSRENYAFFPVRPDMLDAVKSELSKTFKKMGIEARFESQN